MNQSNYLRSLLIFGSIFFSYGFLVSSRANADGLQGRRPNIIFIITDDQGYGDVGAHGNPILRTPSLDRLHREGLRFTDFHVSPTCAPTRSALMTGRHEFKNGVTHTILERERLCLSATTLPQVLSEAGYATGIFGKWHLGDEDAFQPDRRGFEETFIHGAGGIGQSYAGSCGDAPGNTYHNPKILHNGRFESTVGYCTDVFFDQATRWIDTKRSESKPFFAWIATNAPHDPYVAKASDYAKYQGVAPNSRVAHFYGMISNIDENIGRLLDQLERWKIDENTLIVFMNDNGGTAGTEVYNAGMRGQKVTPWLGGTRASSFWRWPGKIAPCDCNALTAHVDVFRTLVELGGAKWHTKLEEQSEGRSLRPLLENAQAPWEDRTLFTHVGRWPQGESPELSKYRQCSVRTKQWHLVSTDGGSDPKWQLFDVSVDYGEKVDVGAKHSDLVADLQKRFDQWWDGLRGNLVNEGVVGPAMNSFRARYEAQYGVGNNSVNPRQKKRPNILFCFADDWGRYASIYGENESKASINSVLSTPSIDEIARRGLLFRNAFVPCPSCTPCRSSLISGQYFWRTYQGAILQGARWDDTLPSFPLLLKNQGYRIGKYQKVWGPGEPNDGPFEKQNFAFESGGRTFSDFSESMSKKVQAGVSIKNAKEQLLEEVANNFRSFMEQQKPDAPFFFWFGPTLTHRSWIPGSGKKYWGIEPDSLKGKLPAALPDVAEVREDVADYLGEVQAWDAGIGVLVRELQARGELENTVIVLSGDHGMPGVSRGKCNLYDLGTNVPLIMAGPGIASGGKVDDFVNLMDLAPTFLDLAGARKPEVMQGRSLKPTLEAALQGEPGWRGLLDSTRDFVITGRERHVAAARKGNIPYPQRALRTKDFLYIRNFEPSRWPMGDPKFDATPPDLAKVAQDTLCCFADMDASPTKRWMVEHRNDEMGKKYYDLAFAKRPSEELYDLASDPDQVTNVAEDTSFRSVLERYRQKLEDELRRHGDPRIISKSPFFESAPFAGVGE